MSEIEPDINTGSIAREIVHESMAMKETYIRAFLKDTGLRIDQVEMKEEQVFTGTGISIIWSMRAIAGLRAEKWPVAPKTPPAEEKIDHHVRNGAVHRGILAAPLLLDCAQTKAGEAMICIPKNTEVLVATSEDWYSDTSKSDIEEAGRILEGVQREDGEDDKAAI